MTKPYVNPQPGIDFTPATDSISIATPVQRLESIIVDALASGEPVNKFLAEKLREGELSKIEAVETLMYAVALGESSSNATYH
ncbi:hypothetical protein [Parendozoicomonas sp. Alg238-R29]|uniref:hypothetical protein n=1 Tax=Parendozoicomonas sp. Alg238-R29 TaxID=2993446 RepID=UPI00248DDD98|nr:hypothetical protein [Parendozoicomonas sp. Alg238-R29]